nr:MAG TPA: hypothetical protein [Caudoviricetes sp.]
MKKFGDYMLPQNAKLAGLGLFGCFYYNAVGGIYYVRIVDNAQHFRLLPYTDLKLIKQTVDFYEI